MTTRPAMAQEHVGVIETDLFCDRCGFNLYTQAVQRDQRLDLLIVRCPECGGHQSAHLRTTAASKWLHRLALLGMLGWIGVTIAFIVGLFFLFLGTFAMAEEGLVRRSLETFDGRTVGADYSTRRNTFEPRFVVAGSVDVPASEVREVARLRPGILPTHGFSQQLAEALLISAIAVVVVFVCGAVLAGACWFWKPGRRYVWLVMPALAYSLLQVIRSTESSVSHLYGVAMPRDLSICRIVDLGVFLTGFTTLALGLTFGRPFARLVLTLLVPPGPRQLFAFLWHCDHKPLPLQTTTPPGTSTPKEL